MNAKKKYTVAAAVILPVVLYLIVVVSVTRKPKQPAPTLRDEHAIRAAARDLVSLIALGWTREEILRDEQGLLGWNDADLTLMENEIDRWPKLTDIYYCLTPGAKMTWLEHTTDNPESGMMYDGSIEFLKSSKAFWHGQIRNYFGLPLDEVDDGPDPS